MKEFRLKGIRLKVIMESIESDPIDFRATLANSVIVYSEILLIIGLINVEQLRSHANYEPYRK